MTYARVSHHSAMLFDTQRNTLYRDGLRKLLVPGAVVLDLGAGLGLHGLLAAAEGASRVYLVEPEPVVQTAAQIARANGLGDKVRVLQGRIEDVQLPEPVDLIVSVFTGNLLYSEDLMPSLFHARDRHLKPGGKLLPDRAQLWLAPLCAPALHAEHVARWSEPVMGIDYASARGFAANEVQWLGREDFNGARRLGEGAAVVDLDLLTALGGDCQGEARCTIEEDGTCHGMLGWIRISLAGQWLSTAPDAPKVHWRPVFLPVDPPLPVRKGEEVVLAIQRPARGDWTWSLQAAAGARRHSSFLAGATSPADMRRSAPGTAPGLSRDGERTWLVLDGLRAGLSNGAIAERLASQEGLTPAEALRRVQSLASRYGGLR